MCRLRGICGDIPLVWLGRIAHIGEFGFQSLQMIAGGGVDDDGLVFPAAVNFADIVTKPLQASLGLRNTEIDHQFVAFGIGHRIHIGLHGRFVKLQKFCLAHRSGVKTAGPLLGGVGGKLGKGGTGDV